MAHMPRSHRSHRTSKRSSTGKVFASKADARLFTRTGTIGAPAECVSSMGFSVLLEIPNTMWLIRKMDLEEG